MKRTFTDENGKKYEEFSSEWPDGSTLIIAVPVQPIESTRWRAEEGKYYWYLARNSDVESWGDDRHEIDDELYELGNYFRTEQEANAVAESFKALLSFVNGEANDNGQWPAIVSQARNALQKGKTNV